MKAIIEIPKGDDRRRHLKNDKSGFIDLGPIKQVIPVNDGIMKLDYGYLPDTLNKADGDEIDVLILSDKQFNVGDDVDIEPIAMIRREDGDNKVVATDVTSCGMQTWSDISDDIREWIEKFFGYHHKIISVENKEETKRYISENIKTK